MRSWWQRWPDSNVIVVTGQVSGIVAIDIDPKHGGDESAVTYDVMKDALSVDTVRALTGGGGVHHLFAWPGFTIGNAANVFPGIDFRGDAGYIVAPGSHHISGRDYEWDSSAHPDDVTLSPLRQSFIDALRSGVRYGSAQAAGGQHAAPRGKFDLNAIMAGTVTIGEGERNEMMTKVIGSLIGDGTSSDDALLVAQKINEQSFVPPLSDREVEAIFRSITNREQRKKDAERKALALMSDPNERLRVNELGPDELLEQAEVLWRQVGVPTVTDWFVMRGGDGVNYILITPEAEIGLGPDLLDYLGIRRRLLNQVAILLPSGKKPSDWDLRALHLRQLAREEIIDPTRAGEQVEEWVARCIEGYGMPEPAVGERRDYIYSQPIVADERLWLRPQALLRLAQQEDDNIKSRDLLRLLKLAGWERGSLACGEGKSIGAWWRTLRDGEAAS